MLCLGLAASLLLCSSFSWAEEYDGPELPEGWYPISTIELTELETILTRQQTTIDRQQTTIEQLGTSFDEYESEAATAIAGLQTELWITRGVAACLAALAVYLVIR
jgi:hypothetical protein